MVVELVILIQTFVAMHRKLKLFEYEIMFDKINF